MGEENLNENDKDKKSLSKIIGVVLFFFVVTFVIGYFFLSDSASDSGKQALEISGTTLSVEYNEYLGYRATIKGVAKNTTKRDYSYASVEFSVYDSSGNNLGTAIDNINNLSSGDTWSFEATLFDFPSTRPSTYKLVEIIVW